MNIYTITDQQGAQHHLDGGVVVTHQQRIDTVEEADASGQAIGTYVPSVVQIAYSDLDGFDDALLARWKITRTVVADPTPPPITVVSMRQAQLALYNAGLLNQVNTLVAQAGGTLQIEWNTASAVDQADPHFQTMVAALGLTQHQVQALFDAAALL